MKKIIVCLFIISIIIISILAIIRYKFNTSMIIDTREKKTGLQIELIDQNFWTFYPKIFYNNSKINITQRNSSLNLKNANIVISKNYWPLSPILIYLKSPITNYEGMEMRNALLNAKYSSNTLYIENLSGNIVEGYLKLKGEIDFDNPNTFTFQGLFKNIPLNTLMKQSKIADWERVNIKLSSPNFKVSGKGSTKQTILNSLKGNVPINGSIYFTSTDEERFGAAFLSLLVEKIPNLSFISQSVDFILTTYANIPSSINGDIIIKDGSIKSKEILITNKKGKSSLIGNYNFVENIIEGTIYFYQQNEIFLEASLEGAIENPKILVEGKVFSEKEEQSMQDIKKLLESGINAFIEKLLSTNE